ncbi:MAG: hypothetical protein PUB20_07725 [Clostridia bacterium]|nr:hypothetical protein [Clostridia bacterium]
MIKFVPCAPDELPDNFKTDSSAAGYIGYDLSDGGKKCGECFFHLNGYSMNIDYVKSFDNDDDTVEGLIRSALNYGANRNVYLANYLAENGRNVADLLGFEINNGILTGEIPQLLAGSCCKHK